MTNEELAVRLQSGNADSAEHLLENNREYFYKLARRLSHNAYVIDDLVQEGAIAMIDAAGSFMPERGTLFLTYATPFIRKAMHSFMARMSLPMAVPAARYSKLRRLDFLLTNFQVDHINRSPRELVRLIFREMSISEKVTEGLLQDYGTVFQALPMDEQWEQSIPCFDTDPAKVYEQRLLADCIQLALDNLTPRERILIQQHLGLDSDDGKGMTFRELAIRLNFNGHSTAEKAYKQAIATLKESLRSKEYKKYLRARQDITKAERMLRPY